MYKVFKEMNRILVGVNALLVVAVGFLFYKLFSGSNSTAQTEKSEDIKKEEAKPVVKVEQVGNTPTGKIAYVNIDKLNEESLEIKDLVAETKRRKSIIEASVESLSLQYQKKVEEFQMSQKAGLASQAEMEAKAREIQALEKEAQNKELQMDDLSSDMNEKNNSFQKTVRELLIRINGGRYDYILSYSESVPTMLLGNTALEITDEVIGQLNSEYKSRKTKK